MEAAVEKAGSFDVDKVVAASPGIELKTAPEGYVKIHENHHLWSKLRIGQWGRMVRPKCCTNPISSSPIPSPRAINEFLSDRGALLRDGSAPASD
jgi:urea transport system substrate-binding protein